MVPPAPTTFSMTTACFSVALIEFRAGALMTVAGTAGRDGTMRVIGRRGIVPPSAAAPVSEKHSQNCFDKFHYCRSPCPWASPVPIGARTGLLVRTAFCFVSMVARSAEGGLGGRLDMIDAATLGEVRIAILMARQSPSLRAGSC